MEPQGAPGVLVKPLEQLFPNPRLTGVCGNGRVWQENLREARAGTALLGRMGDEDAERLREVDWLSQGHTARIAI